MASAVGIYKEKRGNAGSERFVLLVKTGDFDVYYSTSDNWEDTDFELKYTWRNEDSMTHSNSDFYFEDYQNINLINQDDGHVYFRVKYTRQFLKMQDIFYPQGKDK